MLEMPKINAIVCKAAAAALGRWAGIRRVDIKSTVDSDGREALDVAVIIKKGEADRISGESALDALVGIGKALREAGEDRFPIISFVAEEELEALDADPES